MNRQQQEAQKKAKANGHNQQSHGKVKIPNTTTNTNVVNNALGGKNGKKSKKQNSPPQSNPEIANQSVDEILKFIEGNSESKGSKKSKKKQTTHHCKQVT